MQSCCMQYAKEKSTRENVARMENCYYSPCLQCVENQDWKEIFHLYFLYIFPMLHKESVIYFLFFSTL